MGKMNYSKWRDWTDKLNAEESALRKKEKPFKEVKAEKRRIMEEWKKKEPESYQEYLDYIEQKKKDEKNKKEKKDKKPGANGSKGQKPEAKNPGSKDADTKKDEKPGANQSKRQKVSYEGIENEYIHSINYQLSDWEVVKFEELKKDLAITTDAKKKDSIRYEMAVMLGKEKDITFSQDSSTTKTDEKEDETVEEKPTQEHLEKPIPETIEEIKSEYEQMLDRITEGKADDKLYERFLNLKQKAKDLGYTLEENQDSKGTQTKKNPDSAGKSSKKKGVNSWRDKFSNWKKNVGKFMEKIFSVEDLGEDELIETKQEESASKAESEAKTTEKDPFQVLSEEEKKQCEKQVEEISKDVSKTVKEIREKERSR